MITINGIVIKPTIFPDGTSQVWKLPKEILEADGFNIIWNFEAERELIDLISLSPLLAHAKYITLHIPYLPYARQDKHISNDATFNLYKFAELINDLQFNYITAVDVHNPYLTEGLIHGFQNIEVTHIHKQLIEEIKPDYIVFPDKGAADRYREELKEFKIPFLIFEKVRDQATGNVIKHVLAKEGCQGGPAGKGTSFLIIDDICDGGATFISVANSIRMFCNDPDLHLYTTHGIYSKGKQVLEDAGFKLYTTNSLIKNKEGFKV